MGIYPNCPVVTRTIEVGGLSKWQLIHKLQQNAISINEYGVRLLSDDKFTTSESKYILKTVELTIRDLGFPNGATLSHIFKRASELGLKLCPPELGPYLRLEHLNQSEGYTGNPLQQNQAPSGSITIASEIISEEDDFPKGFYLRKINDVLWLRGYNADNLHVWNVYDHFVFCEK